MTITNANDVIATIPDPYKLEAHLKKYNVLNKSRGLFLSLVQDFYEMLADPNIKISVDFSQELLPVFRQAALAMLDETKNRELVKYYYFKRDIYKDYRIKYAEKVEKCRKFQFRQNGGTCTSQMAEHTYNHSINNHNIKNLKGDRK